MKGKVKWFNPTKGYGFITGEDEKDYFLHISDVQGDSLEYPESGQKITFEVEVVAKGAAAKNAVLLERKEK